MLKAIVITFSIFCSFHFGALAQPTPGSFFVNSAVLPDLPCPDGFYCPGDQEPQACPSGSYCPNSTTIFACPEGKFCPAHSWKPRDCPLASSCPEGTSRYFFWGCIVALVASFAGLVALELLVQWRSKKMSSKAAAKAASDVRVTIGHTASGASLWDITPLSVSFEGLEAQVTSWRRPPIKILNGVTGTIQSGKITAVMGPSGAGKSSLFSVLMDKVPRTNGNILINGQPGSLKPYRKVIGFVPQEDVMHRELTVEDVLMHSALTRLPSDWPRAQKEELVSNVIKVLGLEHVRHSIVGDELRRGISGGERKRVNIGIELTSSPSILFLDEPTTGLDASASVQVMEYIQRIAKLGVSVVAILHTPRPEILSLCDDLLLLGRGGTTAYFGPPSNAPKFFESVGFQLPVDGNPADFFLDVLSGQVRRSGHPDFQPSHLPSLWATSAKSSASQPNEPVAAPGTPASAQSSGQSSVTLLFSAKKQGAAQHRKTPNFAVVTWLCFSRMMKQYLHNVRGLTINCFLEMIAGLILAVSFLNTNFVPPLPDYYGAVCPGVIAAPFCFSPERLDFLRLVAFVALAAGLTVATMAVPNFGNEKPIFWRETSSGQNPCAYFIGKCLAELAPIALYCLCFSASFYLVTSHEIPFGDFYGLLYLFMVASAGMGYCASALLDQQGLLVATVAGMIQSLGSGGVDTVQELGWKGYFAWSRYFGEAMLIKALSLDSFSPSQQTAIRAFNEKGTQIDFDNFENCIIGLACHIVMLRILAFVILRIKNNDKQK